MRHLSLIFRHVFRLVFPLLILIVSISFYPAASFADSPAQQVSVSDSAHVETPYVAALMEELESRENQGLPTPNVTIETSVESLEAMAPGQEVVVPLAAMSASAVSIESPIDLVRKTAKITIEFSGPEEAGYETWPGLDELSESDSETVLDYNQIFKDYAAEQDPLLANLDLEDLDRAPRTVVVTETIEFNASEPMEEVMSALYAVPGISSSAEAAAMGLTSTTDDILMGFTYIGPQIWYGIEEEVYTNLTYPVGLPTCTVTILPPSITCGPIPTKTVKLQVIYIKAGVELAWALGLRLPGEATLIGASQADADTDVTLNTSFTTKNWDPAKYHSYDIYVEQARCNRNPLPSTCEQEGYEYIAYVKAFAGIRLSLFGQDICALLPPNLTCGLDEDRNYSQDFVTPLGSNAIFDLGEIALPLLSLPRPQKPDSATDDEGNEIDCNKPENKDKEVCNQEIETDSDFEFTTNLLITPSIGGDQIKADWRADTLSACTPSSTSGTLIFNRTAPAVEGEVTVDKTLTLNDICDDTTVTISNFRYVFNQFLLKLGLGFDISIPLVGDVGALLDTLGLTEDGLKFDVYQFNLSALFNALPELAVGDHIYCTTSLTGIDCVPLGPPNELVHHIEVEQCEYIPEVVHSLTEFGLGAGDLITDNGNTYANSSVAFNLSAIGASDSCGVTFKFQDGTLECNGLEVLGECIGTWGKKTFTGSSKSFSANGLYEITYWGETSLGNTPKTTINFLIDRKLPTISYDLLSPDSTKVCQIVSKTAYWEVKIFDLVLFKIPYPYSVRECSFTNPPTLINGWYNTDVIVDFNASDDEENFGSGIAYLSPKVTFSQDGVYTDVYGEARDKAGNARRINVDTGVIRIDQTPPVTSYTLSSGGSVIESSAFEPDDPSAAFDDDVDIVELPTTVFADDVIITLSAHDNEDKGVPFSGVDKTQYSFDGETWFDYVEPLVFSESQPYSLYYRSIDLAGNLEQSRSTSDDGVVSVSLEALNAEEDPVEAKVVAFIIDKIPPSVICPADFTVFTGPGENFASVQYEVDISDNGEIVGVEQSAGLASGANFPIGETTNTFIVTDSAGNVGSCSFTLTVDPLPVGSLQITKNVEWFDAIGLQTFTLLVEGPDDYSTEVQFNSDGGTATISTLPEGEYTISENVPPGWSVDSNNIKINVVAEQTASVTMTNTENPYCIYADNPNDVLTASPIEVSYDADSDLFTATSVVSNTSLCEYEVGMAAYHKPVLGWQADSTAGQELAAWTPDEVNPSSYTGQFDGNARIHEDSFAHIVPPANGDQPGTIALSVSFEVCAAQIDVVFDASHNVGFRFNGSNAAQADLVPLILEAFHQNNPAWGGGYANTYSSSRRLLRALHYDAHNFGEGWVDLPVLPCEAPVVDDTTEGGGVDALSVEGENTPEAEAAVEPEVNEATETVVEPEATEVSETATEVAPEPEVTEMPETSAESEVDSEPEIPTEPEAVSEPAAPTDSDNDGAADDVDCAINDGTIYPGAAEVANDGIDQDCDGIDLIIDSDGDGSADDEDICEGHDDAIDSDGDSIPDGCDDTPTGDNDGDGIDNAADTTPNGDDDGDGVDNLSDVCLSGDDNLDSDGDGIADACDDTPNGAPAGEASAEEQAVPETTEPVEVEKTEEPSPETTEPVED